MVTLLLCTVAAGTWAQDLEGALEQTRELVQEHRYQDVIDLLAPFAELDDAEDRYVVMAETGRAYFHLGDYPAADIAFREAVRLRPQRVETALYLEASSYLVGEREQAYAIFREVIKSGATDLHLAVTLPGERLFMADPEVWSILDEFGTTVAIDVDRGSVLEVELGMPREETERRLGSGSADTNTALTARAGPYLTWVFGFDENGSLGQIMLHNEHLYRYTPYRLQLMDGLDWRATPASATSALGAPESTTATEDGLVLMIWQRENVKLTLDFAPPRRPAPPGFEPGKPALRIVRMEAIEPQSK